MVEPLVQSAVSCSERCPRDPNFPLSPSHTAVPAKAQQALVRPWLGYVLDLGVDADSILGGLGDVRLGIPGS